VFGNALTMQSVLRAGLDFRSAVRVALAADTASIAVMEIVDNLVMVGVPGAMDSGLGNWLFWTALAFLTGRGVRDRLAGQPGADGSRPRPRRRARPPPLSADSGWFRP